MNITSSLEQDDIVNSRITRGHCSNIVIAVYTTFLTVTDCVLALSQTK